MIRDEILPPFGASLNTFLSNTIGATTIMAEQLYANKRQTVEPARRVDEAKHAWAAVQDELVVDIAEAVNELNTELSSVEGEDDPLVRVQGLIRCRDKKEVLGVVMAQTQTEASAHLDGGVQEAAILMKPVSSRLADVSSRADALIQDELRVLRGALESMEALLHDSLAKLNGMMSQPNPDLSLDGLVKLFKEHLSGLNVDAAEVFNALPPPPAKLEAANGDRASAMHTKLAFDTLKEAIEKQCNAAATRRLGASTSFMLRQATACETTYKHTFTVQPISEDMPPAEIEVEVTASVTGLQNELHGLQARYEAELKRLQVQLAVEFVPLELRYEAEVAHRERLEAELRAERAARRAVEAELALSTSGMAPRGGMR